MYSHFKNQICIYWASFIFYIWYYILIIFSLIVLVSFPKATCSVWHLLIFLFILFIFFCFPFNPIPLCLTSFSFLSLFNLLCRFSSYITFPLCFPNLWNTKLFTISRESGPGSVEINSANCLENPAQIMSWTQQKGLRLHILPIS